MLCTEPQGHSTNYPKSNYVCFSLISLHLQVRFPFLLMVSLHYYSLHSSSILGTRKRRQLCSGKPSTKLAVCLKSLPCSVLVTWCPKLGEKPCTRERKFSDLLLALPQACCMTFGQLHSPLWASISLLPHEDLDLPENSVKPLNPHLRKSKKIQQAPWPSKIQD